MKKIIVGVAVLLLLCSCGNKKANSVSFATTTDAIDSTTQQKSGSQKEEEDSNPTPIEADDSFDDFIYCFGSDETLQRQRVLFPLPYYEGETRSELKKSQWKYDELFTKQSFYTLLFEREEDMDLIGGHALTSVQVEWIYMANQQVKKYFFERVNGAWMLQSIRVQQMDDSPNRDFVSFFERFSTDSLFQSQHVKQPLQFVTVDPDDDFSVIETTLNANQWMAFKPTLYTDKLTNINYGQKNDGSSSSKIVALKGVGNGLSNILYFRRKADGNWELYKFEDTSI